MYFFASNKYVFIYLFVVIDNNSNNYYFYFYDSVTYIFTVVNFILVN